MPSCRAASKRLGLLPSKMGLCLVESGALGTELAPNVFPPTSWFSRSMKSALGEMGPRSAAVLALAGGAAPVAARGSAVFHWPVAPRLKSVQVVSQPGTNHSEISSPST